LVEISDDIFKPAFVVLDAPVIETRFETARIEFKARLKSAIALSIFP